MPHKQLGAKAARKNAPATSEPKRPCRYRPGTATLSVIRRHWKGIEMPVHKLPFQRLAQEIADDLGAGLRFQSSAMSTP